ncbi:deoxyribose-phosphate aldolase [Enterococcus asini]|uniref:deoxyribose-phosphate aldolase n=1 Tax=Enterococcus asini TaxID=57732 RepID=UPI000E4BA5C6|nr:deoxyribose-phosphate aldolase [Enterococcus asini]RGW15173.1 deoxyribose-phosphate aldolase [Enterococcus asini]
MKVSELVSLRLVAPDMKDWELKDTLTKLRQENLVQEVVVLPTNVRRAKQLLAPTAIKIGTVVDYPLGSGTVAKKAFEAGHAFQEGADFIELSVNSYTLLEQATLVAQLEDTLRGIAVTWGEIRTRVAAEQLTEIKKLAILPRMGELGWKCLVLDEGASVADALHDAETFSFDGGEKLQLQLNLTEASVTVLRDLVKNGVTRVGVEDLGDLDLSAELG